MSKLIGQTVECKDRSNEKGVISYYNPDNGEMNIKYGSELLITHISKCKIIKDRAMKFKYSAFTENTPEMREWLEELGYIPLKFFLNGKYIITKFCNRATAKSEWIEHYFESMNNTRDAYTSINCIGNPHLFQAVTAISTTTDIGKHYINNHTGQCKRCDYNMATDENIDWNDWSEATLSELIAHFKVEH